MRVVFRADASMEIGTGHVMRCLSLAHVLRAQKHEVFFVCRDLPKPFDVLVSEVATLLPVSGEEIAASQRVLKALGTPVDWLVTDHYEIGKAWESALRPHTKKILAIDDLANREHDCDILLDQNVIGDDGRYDALVPRESDKLLGPTYALLRREFIEARKSLRTRDGKLERILVFFGGSDPSNETAKALAAIRHLKSLAQVDVVVGAVNPHQSEIKALCEALPGARYHCQVDNMAALMASADLALGAGGTASWERCAVGLPSIVTILADNQEKLVKAAAAAGALVNLGWSQDATADQMATAIEALNAEKLRKMSQLGLQLVDTQGCLRVVNRMSSV